MHRRTKGSPKLILQRERSSSKQGSEEWVSKLLTMLGASKVAQSMAKGRGCRSGGSDLPQAKLRPKVQGKEHTHQ